MNERLQILQVLLLTILLYTVLYTRCFVTILKYFIMILHPHVCFRMLIPLYWAMFHLKFFYFPLIHIAYICLAMDAEGNAKEGGKGITRINR